MYFFSLFFVFFLMVSCLSSTLLTPPRYQPNNVKVVFENLYTKMNRNNNKKNKNNSTDLLPGLLCCKAF